MRASAFGLKSSKIRAVPVRESQMSRCRRLLNAERDKDRQHPHVLQLTILKLRHGHYRELLDAVWSNLARAGGVETFVPR